MSAAKSEKEKPGKLQSGSRVDRWLIEKKLGEGGFGAVYRVTDGSGKYAMKVEPTTEAVQVLKMEVFVLLELSKRNGRHFCTVTDRGRYYQYNYVVMTLVGRSLQDVRKALPGQKMSMGCAVSVAVQCLEALEDLHGIGYLHRDVKPGNYAVGRSELQEQRKIYVLDFGMCRRYLSDDGEVRLPRTTAGFRGTVRYASLSCHVSREQCRKDDLETWLYMIVELTKGALPWRHLDDRIDVGRYKEFCRTNPGLKELTGGCPTVYVDLLQYLDTLCYYDVPNYQYMYTLLRRAMVTMSLREFPYDWERPAELL